MNHDRDLMEAIYNQYATKLERKCNAWLHGKQHYDDVIMTALQQTFLDVFRELDNLPSHDYMDYWITEICRRNFMDALRRQRRFFDRHALHANDEIALLSDETLDFLKDICADERYDEILDILKAPLIPREQRFLHAHYKEDMTLQEIADDWGLSMDAVKSLHKRMKQKIRKRRWELLVKINFLKVTLFLVGMHLSR